MVDSDVDATATEGVANVIAAVTVEICGEIGVAEVVAFVVSHDGAGLVDTVDEDD